MSTVVASSEERIQDVPDYWLTNGLLFEVNRKILHPIGHSLTVTPDDMGAYRFQMLKNSQRPLYKFSEEEFRKAAKKWNNFWATCAADINNTRQSLLGFTVQTKPNWKENQRKV